MYQQANSSAPHIDAPGALGSRGPPLADDLGFDKLSIQARSKSPDPASSNRGTTNSVEKANASYATQEIYQSASEVHPENSLRAIADEVDQTAADLNSDGQYPAVQQAAYASNAYPTMDQHSQPSFNARGSYDPNMYASGGYYGQDGQYVDNGQAAYGYDAFSHLPTHHQQAGGYFGSNTHYDHSSNAYMAAAQGFGLDYPGAPAQPYASYPAQDQSRSMMPTLNRQSTQMSMGSVQSSGSAVATSTRRRSKEGVSKASQQQQQQQQLPFNKHFVDEYRQRMKGDPDPEAQFAYARYLIEAAKKVHDPKDGPKQARKYRDALLSESLKLIKRLATTGMGLGKPPFAEAQFFLANCFGNGSLGLQVDHEKAYNLYVQASKQNHAAATYRTAVCNEVGAGTRRDHHRAVLFYRKASALGDTAGMYKLGMILLNGLLGQPRNIREAIVWLKRAAGQADEDNPHALHELGLLYEKQNSNVVVHDEAYARELFTQAAQLGYAPSQFKLGSAYEYGTLTCPVDPRRSIAWYTKAAGKNDGESELALSGWYLTGSEGVLKQSDSEAYLWARRAATKGIPKAEYAVGYYSEVGIGVDADIDEAKRWYMRAAAQGNKRAMMRLTELKQQKGGRMGRKGARPTRKDAETECIIM